MSNDSAQEQQGISTLKPKVIGRPFVKGTSGNPGGRKKGVQSVSACLRELLSRGNNAQVAAEAIYQGVLKGDAQLTKILLDRTDGKVEEIVHANITGSGFGPVTAIFQLPLNGREPYGTPVEASAEVHQLPEPEAESGTAQPEPAMPSAMSDLEAHQKLVAEVEAERAIRSCGP